jgi:hypothetical protein
MEKRKIYFLFNFLSFSAHQHHQKKLHFLDISKIFKNVDCIILLFFNFISPLIKLRKNLKFNNKSLRGKLQFATTTLTTTTAKKVVYVAPKNSNFWYKV